MKKAYYKFENYPHRDFPVYSSIRENVKNIFGFHYHKDGEFLKVVRGKIKVCCGNKEHILEENDVVFFSPYTIHGGFSETESVCTHSLTFDTSILKDYADYSKTLASHIVFRDNLQINENFDNVFNAYRSEKNSANICMLSGLLMLTGLLMECGFIQDENVDKKRTFPVIKYIEDNYNKEISISEMASLLNYCPNHLIRVFKEENNRTPFEYMTDYRLHIALELLSENKYSVSEIAGLTGFSDSSHFIKVFKKKLNTTPGRYKNKIL